MGKKYQKELNINRNEESELTEYEDNFLLTPDYGPHQSDTQFDTYHCFEFFSKDYLKSTYEEFKETLLNYDGINSDHLEKIEKGIKAFTDSSTKLLKDSALLYKSILLAYPDIITKKYDQSDEEIKQLIPREYFEMITKCFNTSY